MSGFFFLKHKTEYEVRMSDWSSDVCSSDLVAQRDAAWCCRKGTAAMMHEFEDRDDPKPPHPWRNFALMTGATIAVVFLIVNVIRGLTGHGWNWRSEEHTSELQSLMRISYAVCGLKKKNRQNPPDQNLRQQALRVANDGI